MYLPSNHRETSDSLELIIRSYHYPESGFLQMIAEKELQSRFRDLFAEIELVLIACASASVIQSSDNQRLAASVTCRASASIIDGKRIRLALPPLV